MEGLGKMENNPKRISYICRSCASEVLGKTVMQLGVITARNSSVTRICNVCERLTRVYSPSDLGISPNATYTKS